MWTAALTERLVELHTEGTKSFASIAKLLGVTTGSAIGRANRLGLTRGARSSVYYTHGPSAPGPKRVRRAKPRQIQFGGPQGKCEASAPVVIPPPTSPTPPLLIPLTETTRHQCKFIQGNDDLTCGHPAIGDRPWCAYHLPIVYQVGTAWGRRP